MSSISQILKNQMAIMEALSQLLPSKNPAQSELIECAAATVDLLVQGTVRAPLSAQELGAILNSEDNRKVQINPDGFVVSGSHGFVNFAKDADDTIFSLVAANGVDPSCSITHSQGLPVLLSGARVANAP
jgi:hypothetical protein